MTTIAPIKPPVADELRDAIRNHLLLTVGEAEVNASVSNWRMALTRAIRDRIVTPWLNTGQKVRAGDRKCVYYLSMEFLIGRILEDAIVNLGLEEEVRRALDQLGMDYDAVVTDEPDAALGNGGLGRLAACFLDSMSTLQIPAFGYGIRYHHGLFKQTFENGWQVETAEDWLRQGHGWEFERTNAVYTIGFGGRVRSAADGKSIWEPEEQVLACAYDTPTPGWRGQWVNTLRLWSAEATEVFDLEPFNRGDFIAAAAPNILAETISRVLYPDDTTDEGKRLRLKQEFFFTAASLRDLVDRFKRNHDDLSKLPEKVVIQLNDTHPAIAGPELVRLLVDEHNFAFRDANDLTRRCLNYTNHTLMPEALEKWSVDLLADVLPRHMQIIEMMDDAHDAETRSAGRARQDQSRIVNDGVVHMGNLAFIAADKINGVSQLHTNLMRETVFSDLNALHPDRIVCQTNGVTPRRWLRGCNAGLSSLLTEVAGPDWEVHLDKLELFKPHANDAAFRQRFADIKRANKVRLSNYLSEEFEFKVDPDAMFDIQIKRIHEYKRQLMNILETAALWNEMRRRPNEDWPARVKIFGGKAAPGYVVAKQIIKLINDIGQIINNDPVMRGRLKVVYPPDYNVSMAEMLIPAADLSEQISTAGMEASGTGNMKLAMNGALTIGTLDGANVEIRNAVGDENIFIFGMTADEVTAQREKTLATEKFISKSAPLKEVIGQIEAGVFSPDEPARYHQLANHLRTHDWFMVMSDFQPYYDMQRTVDDAWRAKDDWTRCTILNTAAMGWFSSDRTISGYAREIWNVPV